MRLALTFAMAWTLAATGSPAGETTPPPPQRVNFTAKPTVTKAGDRHKIAFAVSAPTDVAVYIEDAKGEVVRHLVAGVLGPNPPPPLKPGLAQEVEWDGKADYGRPLPSEASGGGGFRVRVALGLGMKYDRVLHSNQPDLRLVGALAMAPDGTLHVSGSGPFGLAGSGWRSFGRDGGFIGSWAMPPGPEATRYFGWTSDDGRPDPMNFKIGKYMMAGCVLRSVSGSDAAAVGRDGADLFQIGNTAPICIYRYPLTATCPRDDSFAVKVDAGAGVVPVISGANGLGSGLRPQGCLAVSSDGKRLYIGGLWNRVGRTEKLLPAVYSVKCPERTGCQVVFGDPAKAGSDEKSLGGTPGGLAVDGRGRLFIVDEANNRVVVVDEKDGRYLGEIGVEKPCRVGFAARTGAVYVLAASGKDRFALQRFNPPAGSEPAKWKGLKPEASIAVNRSYHGTVSYLAVDEAADPTVIWVGGGCSRTVRVEDPGTGPKFGESRFMPDPKFGGKGAIGDPLARWPDSAAFGDVQVDRLRKEIYFRNGKNGIYRQRFSEKTGESELIAAPVPAMQGGGTGLQVVPAANGNLYGLQWPRQFFQWERSGKPLAWQEPRKPDADELKNYGGGSGAANYRQPAFESYVPVSMSGMPRMLGTRWSDGHLFVLEPYRFAVPVGGRTHKSLHEYLPTGRRLTAQDAPVIWKLSDAAVGPKFDAAGNIYVAEAVRPKGWLVPPEMDAYFANKGAKAAANANGQIPGALGTAACMYGSIVKFGPKGGMIHWDKDGKKGPFGCGIEPYTGEPKLDPELKSADVDYLALFAVRRSVKATGAEWVHPGVGHIGFYGCNCENITFDVDEFGRTFFGDTPQFQLRVIDTAGNAIAKFGGYGGANCMGPESPVVDPKTNRVRARRADDPKDMKSPFAEPELAFQWLLGVGVTDRYAYLGDSINQRMLRARLVYAAEESCPVGP